MIIMLTVMSDTLQYVRMHRMAVEEPREAHWGFLWDMDQIARRVLFWEEERIVKRRISTGEARTKFTFIFAPSQSYPDSDSDYDSEIGHDGDVGENLDEDEV